MAMKVNMEVAGIFYQTIVLLAVIGLNLIYFFKTGKLNDTLIGALIGVMVSLPIRNQGV
jgi:hypothetical protein